MKYLQCFCDPAKFLFMYRPSTVQLFPKGNTLMRNIRNIRVRETVLMSKELTETDEEHFIKPHLHMDSLNSEECPRKTEKNNSEMFKCWELFSSETSKNPSP